MRRTSEQFLRRLYPKLLQVAYRQLQISHRLCRERERELHVAIWWVEAPQWCTMEVRNECLPLLDVVCGGARVRDHTKVVDDSERSPCLPPTTVLRCLIVNDSNWLLQCCAALGKDLTELQARKELAMIDQNKVDLHVA